MAHDANGDSPEKITKALQDYYKSIEEEFKTDTSTFDPVKKQEFADRAKAKLVQLIPTAVTTLEMLMVHGQKETTKLSAAKFVLENALSDKIVTPVDPMQDLLNEMNKKGEPAPTHES
jgi:hypothetical protein